MPCRLEDWSMGQPPALCHLDGIHLDTADYQKDISDMTSLRRIPSSSHGRLSKARSKSRLKRVQSSVLNLFEGDLTQGLSPLRAASFVRNSSSCQLEKSAATAVLAAIEDQAGSGSWGGGGLRLKIDQPTAAAATAASLSSAHSQAGGVAGTGGDNNKKSLSERILKSWFFHKLPSSHADGEEDDIDEDGHEITPDPGRNPRKSLTQLIARRFSAATDFRELNLVVPQST